ncbi:MAG: hypothetical protein GY859_23685, partial [Desulfobacterales bacterium]|nr:hypothetical protein [Desulfobacterales bacterium]
DPPVITWTHPGGDIAGYDLYFGPREDGKKMNAALLTQTTFTDIGYSGNERHYTIVAVDSFNQESTPRSVTLPILRAELAEGSLIRRGIMNHVEYEVENLSTTPVENVRVKNTLIGKSHISEPFTIPDGATETASVVVGGYAGLGDYEPITTTIRILPPTGEKVEIIRTSDIEVADGMMVLRILNEEFTRGGSGAVRFTLENTGAEEIEIITAKNSGNSASTHIQFYLMDEDENTLAASFFKQSVGSSLVTLSNKNTVARIPAGETFTSDWTTLSVPANAPDRLIIHLSISNIYHHHGKPDQVTMTGLSTTHEVSLLETSYYGEVTQITPETSNGDEEIVITGHAVERSTGIPLPDVPLNLVI